MHLLFFFQLRSRRKREGGRENCCSASSARNTKDEPGLAISQQRPSKTSQLEAGPSLTTKPIPSQSSTDTPKDSKSETSTQPTQPSTEIQPKPKTSQINSLSIYFILYSHIATLHIQLLLLIIATPGKAA